MYHVSGLAQDCGISIAYVLEMPQCCSNQAIDVYIDLKYWCINFIEVVLPYLRGYSHHI